MKFKTVEGKGKLVLKITDDVTVRRNCTSKCTMKLTPKAQCIKFKTFSSIFLNRFEALNLTLIQKMQNVDPAQIAEPIAAAASTGASTLTAVDAGASGSALVAAAAPSVGGVKKKKAKKKK